MHFLCLSLLKMQVVYDQGSQIYRLRVIKVLTYTCMWSMFLFLHVCGQCSYFFMFVIIALRLTGCVQ